MELSLGDVAAVVIYFLLILGIGFWVGDIIRKNTTNHSSLISVPGQTSPRDSGGLLPGREVHVLAARGRLLVCREHRQ